MSENKEIKMPKTDVTVKLIGKNGNAFSIIRQVMSALAANGQGELAREYEAEAMSGDYNNLLQTTMEYVNVE